MNSVPSFFLFFALRAVVVLEQLLGQPADDNALLPSAPLHPSEP